MYLPSFTNHLVEMSNESVSKQLHVDTKTYCKCIDWIFQLACKANRKLPVFFTAVNVFQKLCMHPTFLLKHSKRTIVTTCFYMATKYEEDIFQDYNVLEIFGKTSMENILRCEIDIWVAVDFNMACCNHIVFLRALTYSIDEDYPQNIRQLAKFLLIASMYSSSTIHIKPHLLVSSCLFIARHHFAQEPTWDMDHEDFSQCDTDTVISISNKVAMYIVRLFRDISKDEDIHWSVMDTFAKNRELYPYIYTCIDSLKQMFEPI